MPRAATTHMQLHGAFNRLRCSTLKIRNEPASRTKVRAATQRVGHCQPRITAPLPPAWLLLLPPAAPPALCHAALSPARCRQAGEPDFQPKRAQVDGKAGNRQPSSSQRRQQQGHGALIGRVCCQTVASTALPRRAAIQAAIQAAAHLHIVAHAALVQQTGQVEQVADWPAIDGHNHIACSNAWEGWYPR